MDLGTDILPQTIGYPQIIEKKAQRKQERLDKKSTLLDNIDQAIMMPMADNMASSVCSLFRAPIDLDEPLKDWCKGDPKSRKKLYTKRPHRPSV